MTSRSIRLTEYIRAIPDFPKEGILFRDITPLLADAGALAAAIDELARPFRNQHIEAVAAVEARGFIFGSAVARALNAGFVPLRKKGKLPWHTEAVTYALEYGTDTIEVHRDGIREGMRVLMVDDLLATGGTMTAACELVEKLGGIITGLTFLIELTDMPGRKKLAEYPIHVAISY